jgi:anti-anti-sigma factor
MPFEVKLVNDVAVVKFGTRSLEETTIHTIESQLCTLVDEFGHGKLHFDFSDIHALTSTGLGKLVTLHKKVRNKGGSLSLHNVNPLVYELFEVTRLNTLLDIRRHDQGAGPTELSLGLPHPAL